MKRKETMCAKYVQMVPALLRKRWLGACVLVLGLHGALGAEPSTISEIRDLLASPGQFKDCVFKDDKFHRCGWSTNGFFIATSENENELKSLNATKFVVGRFGNAFWKSGGGAVTIMDQTKIDAASFQKHFGDVAAFERLAFKPVSFGVLPMAPGPVKFSEFNIFESRDFLGAPFTGGLSVVDDQHITIDYTIPSLPGWKYRSHVAAILGAFPFSEFTIASGPEGTNYIDGITVRYCEISHDEIPSNYFHPTNILKKTALPSVIAVVTSNSMVTYNDGRRIKAEGTGGKAGRLPLVVLIFAVGVVLAVAAKTRLIRGIKEKGDQ